jgi:hypothetical protein
MGGLIAAQKVELESAPGSSLPVPPADPTDPTDPTDASSVGPYSVQDLKNFLAEMEVRPHTFGRTLLTRDS